MTQNNADHLNATIRQRAEAKFRDNEAQTLALSPEETRHLLHELQVHQIELEMQNDELRRTQAELDAARESYFDLYNLAPVGYLTISEQGLILEANLTAASLLGLARGELVKKPISRFIFKDDQDHYYLHRKQLIETGEPQACELRMLKKDGMVFWAHLMATAAQADNGTFVGRVVLNDITEHKRAEQALKSGEQKFHEIFNNVNDAIYLMNLAEGGIPGKFIEVNDVACRMLGYSREELLNLSPGDINAGDIAEKLPATVEPLLLQGQMIIEAVHRTKDGRDVPFEINSHLVEIMGDTKILSVARNITERKQIENAQLFLLQCGNSGEDFFEAIARYLAKSLDMDYVCIDRLQGDELTAQTVAIYFDGKFDDNVVYALKDTPCGKLVGKTICCFPEQVRHLFPQDVVLQEMLAESYIGTTLWNSEGQPIGLIALVGRKPLNHWERGLAESVLKLVAIRAAGELERRQTEDEIKHLASFPRLNPQLVLEVNASGEIEYYNPAVMEALNRLELEDNSRVFLPNDIEALLKALVQHPDPGTMQKWERLYREVTINGAIFGEHIHLVPEFMTVRIYASDITEHKQAEEALRIVHSELELRVSERTEELAVKNKELLNEISEREEVERHLRIQTTAMEAAANGILITDPHGNIQWVNPALTQISGYSAHELIGQNTHIFKSGKHRADFYSQLWNTVFSGQVWRGEMTNRRKDGSLYTEEQTITPVQDEKNKIRHFIAIKQDITERKRAEMELEQRNVELQALTLAERELRQFAEALVKAAIILNKSLKLDEVLAHILGEIKGVISYQLADVTLLDGDTFYDASHEGKLGWPVNLPGTSHFPLKDFPLFAKIIRTGQPVVIPDTRKEADWVSVNGLEWSLSFLSVPLLVEGQVIGFVNLFAEQPGFFTEKMCDQLVAFAAHAAVAIQNAWLFEQIRAGSERLHSLSRRLVEIQENERRYISRELHDEAGQLLTSLMVDLRLLEKKASQPEAVKKMIAEMEGALNQVLENLHRVAMALRPASLDHLGLVAALTQHIESIGCKYDLKISFNSRNIQKRLPENVETILYRIVQEALTNVVRHAHATRADVVLTERDGKLILIVEDDGVGFDPDVAIGAEHLGLFGMRERVEMIDGKLVIESSPGKGTTLIVEVNNAETIVNHG